MFSSHLTTRKAPFGYLMTMLSRGTRRTDLRCMSVSDQRLPKPIIVERMDSIIVARRAKPSEKAMERTRRAILIAIPRKCSHARGPKVLADTFAFGPGLVIRSQRTA